MKAQGRQRRIQKQVSKADKVPPRRKAEVAIQAGARDYPVPPLPKQHQIKPGSEQQFLESPQCSSYITGEILPIICGYSGG